MQKKISQMNRKDFLSIPDRKQWDKQIGCDSIVMIPMGKLHESGYTLIKAVACQNEVPVCCVTTSSDLLTFFNSGRLKIDCLPKSKLFRAHAFPGKLLIGPELSSLDIQTGA